MHDAVLTVLTPPRRRAVAVGLVLLVMLVLGARRLASAGTITGAAIGACAAPADAIERAGGAAAKADLAGVNLAAPVVDGTQVVVPALGAARASPGGGTGAATGPVSLSSATVEELDTLPGIGPVTAEKIVSWRDAHGPFRSVDDLDAVPGIGPTRIEQLRELVTP